MRDIVLCFASFWAGAGLATMMADWQMQFINARPRPVLLLTWPIWYW